MGPSAQRERDAMLRAAVGEAPDARDQAVSEREEERRAGWERAHAARLKRECWAGGWAARERGSELGYARGKWAEQREWEREAGLGYFGLRVGFSISLGFSLLFFFKHHSTN